MSKLNAGGELGVEIIMQEIAPNNKHGQLMQPDDKN